MQDRQGLYLLAAVVQFRGTATQMIVVGSYRSISRVVLFVFDYAQDKGRVMYKLVDVTNRCDELVIKDNALSWRRSNKDCFAIMRLRSIVGGGVSSEGNGTRAKLEAIAGQQASEATQTEVGRDRVEK